MNDEDKKSVDEKIILRISILEQKTKRLNQLLGIAIACIVIGISIVVWGVVAPQKLSAAKHRTFEAENFILRDAKGQIRATFDAEYGPGLKFLDTNGKVLIGLAAQPESSYLYINDKNGAQRAILSVLANELRFGLNDLKGKETFVVHVNKDGSKIEFRDQNGAMRTTLAFTSQGPYLMLRDNAGRIRVGLAVAKDGPRLLLNDAQGKARIGLNVDNFKGAQLGFMDSKGKMQFFKP